MTTSIMAGACDALDSTIRFADELGVASDR